MYQPNFLTNYLIQNIRSKFQLPVFVYSEKEIKKQANAFLNFPNAYGIKIRFAMKANPNQNILRLFNSLGIGIDASSAYEVERALLIGIPANEILLTAQEKPNNLAEIISKGINYNACSLHQLESYGKIFPGTEISVRINPGLGSGETNRVNVGGPTSSFGIRYKYIPNLLEIAKKYQLKIKRVHSHIGCGTNPDVRENVAVINLQALENFPDAEILNLGGGLKIARMSYDKSADLQKIGENIKKKFEDFFNKTGRKIKLELEPGTYLMASCASLISEIQDIVDTGQNGYKFLKINSGMTEVTRTTMYGSQHPIIIINNSEQTEHYIVSGHCCESGDILTCKDADPEELKPRLLKQANIGDILIVEGVGAYCSGMSLKNYNSFPEAGEILIRENGDIVEIRKRQNIKQIIENEIHII